MRCDSFSIAIPFVFFLLFRSIDFASVECGNDEIALSRCVWLVGRCLETMIFRLRNRWAKLIIISIEERENSGQTSGERSAASKHQWNALNADTSDEWKNIYSQLIYTK